VPLLLLLLLLLSAFERRTTRFETDVVKSFYALCCVYRSISTLRVQESRPMSSASRLCRYCELYTLAILAAPLGSMNNASASTILVPSPSSSPKSSIQPFTHAFRPSTFVVSALSTR
jgi:hypothetical protein